MLIDKEMNKKSISPEKEPSSFEKWLTKYRLTARKNFALFQHSSGMAITDWPTHKISPLLTILPLTLGFSQFVINEAGRRNHQSFFVKTLPLFQNFEPKFNFETFEYIVKFNDVEKLSETSFLLGQPEFIGKIGKSFSSKKFNGLSSDSFTIFSEKNYKKKSVKNIFKQLDELPSYLKALDYETSKTFEEPFAFRFAEQKDQKKFQKQKSAQKNSSLESISSDSFKKIPLILQKDLMKENFPVKKPVFRKDFEKNRLAFQSNVELLKKEFLHLFSETLIETNFSNLSSFISPDQNKITRNKKINSTLLEKVLTKKVNFHDQQILIKLFQELNKIDILSEIEGTRIMSGYNFPDVTQSDLLWFYILNSKNQTGQDFSETTSSFQKKLSWSIPRIVKKYPFTLKKLPQIGVQTKNIVFRNHEEKNTVIYEGPSVILDQKKALDWKTVNSDIRNWFQQYLSPSNSLIQHSQNFLGNYHSPEFLINGQIPDFSDFPNNFLYRSRLGLVDRQPDWVIEPESRISLFSPFDSSLIVPAVQNTKKTFEKGNLKGIFFKVSKNEEKTDFLPLIQVQQPRIKGTKQFLSYSSLFDFGFKGNPDYSFSLLAGNQTLSLTNWAPTQYKKTSSLFNSKKENFVENWEPLSSNSWLILTQLSFAVFIFNVLKSLADNYGRELLGYLLDLVAALGFLDPSLQKEIEILTGRKDKGFRIVLQSKKNFNDVVGIQRLLPELYEVLWFLRNSARDFALSSSLPRGILLTGPPGTGKTLLVQAIAGEAQVPVVVLSGSSLIEPGDSGAVKLEMVFQEARELAPCIVFIDEIDSLAAKRSGLIQNPMGADEVLESLISVEKIQTNSIFETFSENKTQIDSEKETVYSSSQPDQIKVLTQFLIELDGIKGRDGIIVIGATNRPEVLDAALLRPGRLDKIIQVPLPSHEKRVELLQFYSTRYGNLKLTKDGEEVNPISWDYLAARTIGFSAADLATVMNESAIQSGLLVQASKDAYHSILTIEHGIDRLTTSENEKYLILKSSIEENHTDGKSDIKFQTATREKISISSKLLLIRLAYYQAGKTLLSYLLKTHPKSVFASLWPRRPSLRAVQITTNLQNSVFETARLAELNDRVIGCYGGKAAEFLFLAKFSVGRPSVFSTLGLEDLIFAQKLAYSMLEKWSFYSKKTHTQQIIKFKENLNNREFRDNPEKLEFYQEIQEKIEFPPMIEAILKDTSSLKSEEEIEKELEKCQVFYSIPWWQQEVSSELEFKQRNFANGTRLYLYNPEQNERNVEWLPPDECYHSSSSLKNIKKAVKNFETVRKGKIKKDDVERSSNRIVPGIAAESFISQERKQPGVNLENSTLSEKSKIKSRVPVYFPWNDVTHLSRDYTVHSLILQSFNKALISLNKNRELLDKLVITLLSNEILRQPEIEDLLEGFQKIDLQETVSSLDTTITRVNPEQQIQDPKTQDNVPIIQIVENAWGPHSRKPLPRWIDFEQLRKQTT